MADKEEKYTFGTIISMIIVAVIFTPLLSVGCGMLVGLISDFWFKDYLLPMFNGTFLEGHSLVEIGGFLGFVGSFFQTKH